MTRLFKLVFLLALIGFIILLAPNYIGEQGYIHISLAGWVLEGSVTSLLSIVAAAVFALFTVYLLLRYLIQVVVLPSTWWRNRSSRSQLNHFQSGIDFMTMAMWQQASEQFLKVKSQGNNKTAQELALVCAIRSGEPELMEKVKKATQLEGELPALTNLVHLTQQGQYQQAFESADKLDINWLKSPLPIKQLWLDIQLQNHNWAAVNKHLAKLNKQVEKQADETTIAEWHQFLQGGFTRSFDTFVSANSVAKLTEVWSELPKPLQQLEPVLSSYITILARAKQLQLVEALLLKSWRQNKQAWLVDNLRLCYQQAQRVQMDKLFSEVQKAATHSAENKLLLTAYAYLAAGQKDIQLAKQALEQVIYSNKNQQDFAFYADTLAELGEVRHSIEVYQQLHQS